MSKIESEKILEELLRCEEFRKYMKYDKALELLLRDGSKTGGSGHAWVYYRGGGLMRFEFKEGVLTAYADENYGGEIGEGNNGKSLEKAANLIAQQKKAMDFYKIDSKKRERNRITPEKEAMQLLAQANNKNREALGTDYYIADMEYQITKKYPVRKTYRFDGVGLYWSTEKRGRKPVGLPAIVEMKYGTKAVGNGDAKRKATISAHIRDLYEHFCGAGSENEDYIRELWNDVIAMLARKERIEELCKSKSFSEVKFKDGCDGAAGSRCHYILALADYTPKGKKGGYYSLAKELRLAMKQEDENSHIIMYDELRKKGFRFFIARSSFMGYGLYYNNGSKDNSLIEWDKWLEQYNDL